MSVPVLTFFNNKSGIGTTSLVYHLAWMLSDMGYRVLACDLDPQANLTAAFLDEDHLETLWDDESDTAAKTILQCVRPLTKVSDTKQPTLAQIPEPSLILGNLALIPGDLGLVGFEDTLSSEWPRALGPNPSELFRLTRPIRALNEWFNRMPEEYARNLCGDNEGPYPVTPAEDKECALAIARHYRSLVPMAKKARKPIFHLTTADGAIGSHAAAANDARRDFKNLAKKIVQIIQLDDT